MRDYLLDLFRKRFMIYYKIYFLFLDSYKFFTRVYLYPPINFLISAENVVPLCT